MKEYFEILKAFFSVGIFTFGGGYAIVPVVERELINKRGWVTMDELIDYYTISQITPGLIGVNLSTFVGYKKKGVGGGILATLGYVLPGTILVTIAALFIGSFADIPLVQHAFTGVRIAVGALILDTVVKLVKGVFKKKSSPVIYILVFMISVLPHSIIPSFLKSPVLLVAVSGLAGLWLYRRKKNEPPANERGIDIPSSQEEDKGREP